MTVNAATLETMRARIAELEAEVAQVKAPKPLTFKVAPKGGLSVYGLQMRPVTLYREQWERVLGEAEQIKAFIETHKSDLKVKE